MRMKGARKNAQGMITEPGNMVIYVAGYPAIMGFQPLYFRDSSSPAVPGYRQRQRKRKNSRTRWLRPAGKSAQTEQQLAEHMVAVDIIDALSDTEHWLNWSRYFGPISVTGLRLRW